MVQCPTLGNIRINNRNILYNTPDKSGFILRAVFRVIETNSHVFYLVFAGDRNAVVRLLTLVDHIIAYFVKCFLWEILILHLCFLHTKHINRTFFKPWNYYVKT